MNTYPYSLDGATAANIAAVKTALDSISDCTNDISLTAKGGYVTRVHSDLPESIVFASVSMVLSPLRVKAVKMIELPPLSVGFGSSDKFID